LGDVSRNEEVIKKIFQEVDENSDGVISKEEFVKLLMNHTKNKLINQKS
jgi:Ca2+-binding EF-hand superfamily protein